MDCCLPDRTSFRRFSETAGQCCSLSENSFQSNIFEMPSEEHFKHFFVMNKKDESFF